MLDTERNEEFTEIIRKRLNEKRFIHSLNVAECAKKLADIYGGNKEKSFTAGLLHDIMKNADKSEQLQIINEGKIILTEEEKDNPKLWHAIAGAEYMRNKLNVRDEEIIDAVRYHTTGKKNMSLLAKIIYIADYISDDRDYPGIEEIRAAAYESLEKAMMIGLEFSIKEIVGRKQIIHPDSIDAYNELILKKLY